MVLTERFGDWEVDEHYRGWMWRRVLLLCLGGVAVRFYLLQPCSF